MTVDDGKRDPRVDPRFRRMPKKATKVVVDERFQPMFEEKQFVRPVKVDKYGRPIAIDREQEDLRRFYRLEVDKGQPEDGDEKIRGSEEIVTGDSDDESVSADSDGPATKNLIMDEALSSHPLVSREVPIGEATRRLALVNLDWEQIGADDIYTLVLGFKPATGFILSVTIYPSRFGRERMVRESLEGPPKELFDESIESYQKDEEEEEEEEDEQIALRRYQLERLRYYYAVIECDSVETAHSIYKCCDGAEFEKSANFLDFRFIPDAVTFDVEQDGVPRDICTEPPKNYWSKSDLSTSALQSTRVKLTWDADDAERVRTIRRPLKGDEEDADLRAYLASSESEGDDEDLREKTEMYRRLLEEDGHNVFGRKNAAGDLSITFVSALHEEDDDNSANQTAVFDDIQEPGRHLIDGHSDEARTGERAPFAKYLERRKAKKQARKEAAEQKKEQETQERKKKSHRKKEKENSLKQREQLSMFLDDNMVDDDEDLTRKQSKRQIGNIDLADDRFAAIYEDPGFALDPSHPSFKRIKSADKIIKERQRRIYK